MDERLLARLLREACERHDVSIRALSDGWLLELEKDGKKRRVLGTEFGVNDQAASAIAKDKVATSTILERAAIDHVSHRLLTSHGSGFNKSLLSDMLATGPAVVKPLQGSHGVGVALATTIESAWHIIERSGILAWAVSPYYDVAFETRVVVLDGTVRLAYKKVDPVIMNGLKFFNLHVGAKAVAVDIDELGENYARLATDVVDALGLSMAAVDIITDTNGTLSVLEVNSAFSLNRFAQSGGKALAMTTRFYDEVVSSMFKPAGL